VAGPFRPRIDEDHDCRFREELEQLRAIVTELRNTLETEIKAVHGELEKTRDELAALKRRFLGPKAGKIKPIGHEVRAKVGADPAAARLCL
jgi:hypothetical protein